MQAGYLACVITVIHGAATFPAKKILDQIANKLLHKVPCWQTALVEQDVVTGNCQSSCRLSG